MKRVWAAGAAVVAILAFIVLVTVVSPLTSVDNGRSGNHVVAGRELGPESSCPADVPVACAVAAAVGLQVLVADDPNVMVTGTASAPPACPDGETFCTGAGLARPWYVVFDIQGAPRRAVELLCSGPVYLGQQMVTAARCDPATSN